MNEKIGKNDTIVTVYIPKDTYLKLHNLSAVYKMDIPGVIQMLVEHHQVIIQRLYKDL